MKLPVWIHNVASAYPGNGGLPVDDSANPFSHVYGKTNDGLRFQGVWDDHATDINSVEDVVHHDREIYQPQGIEYVPWGVVHGRWEGDWSAGEYARDEGRMAAAIAMAAAGPGETPTYIVDLEPHYHAPFPAYWRDDLGAAEPDIREFVVQFRNNTNGLGRLWLAVDAREPHLEPVKFAYWASFDAVERILPMVYFTDFARPAVAQTYHARDALRTMESVLGGNGAGMLLKRHIHPIFPGDALPEVMEYAIEEAFEQDFGGVSVWQRGNLTLNTADRIAAMDDPWVQAPQPPAIDVASIRLELDTVERAAAVISAQLGLIDTAVEEIREELASQ